MRSRGYECKQALVDRLYWPLSRHNSTFSNQHMQKLSLRVFMVDVIALGDGWSAWGVAYPVDSGSSRCL